MSKKLSKTQRLIMKFYKAIIDKDAKKERKLWLKIVKKSFKGKDTHAIK